MTQRARRVLILEDDTSVGKSLQRVLEQQGFVVVLTDAPETAILLSESETFDLMLLELNLPDQPGWGVYEQIAHRCPCLPIIAITASPHQQGVAAAMGVGALLEKPLEAPLLLETMERLLAEPLEKRLAKFCQYLDSARQLPGVGAGYLRRLPGRPVDSSLAPGSGLPHGRQDLPE